MTRRVLLALAVIATVLGCTADPPAAVPVPEPAAPQSKVHCDLIFPAPLPPSEDEVLP